MTRSYVTPVVVFLLAASLVATATPAIGSADGLPPLEQGPVEFTALDSGDGHVELVFADSINRSAMRVEVVAADGTVVADDDDVNEWNTDEAEGRLWIDLGDTELTDDATVRIETDAGTRTYSVDASDAFVQNGYDTDTTVTPGEPLALVDLTTTNRSYEVRNESGAMVTAGSLGDASHVELLDTSGWEANETYEVTFIDGETSSVEVEDPSGASSTSEHSSHNSSGADDTSGAADSTATAPEPTEYLALENETIHNKTVAVGENVTVSATFVNVGNEAGDFWAWLAYGEEIHGLDRRLVTGMGIDERRHVEFTVSFQDPGEYEVILSGRIIGTITVEAGAAEPAPKLGCIDASTTASQGLPVIASNGYVPTDQEQPRFAAFWVQSTNCGGA